MLIYNLEASGLMAALEIGICQPLANIEQLTPCPFQTHWPLLTCTLDPSALNTWLRSPAQVVYLKASPAPHNPHPLWPSTCHISALREDVLIRLMFNHSQYHSSLFDFLWNTDHLLVTPMVTPKSMDLFTFSIQRGRATIASDYCLWPEAMPGKNLTLSILCFLVLETWS